MTVIVQRLTDDNEFESIGRVEDGEITDGEDALTNIDQISVWQNLPEDELAARFDGPRVMAGIVDEDDGDETVEEDFSDVGKTPGTTAEKDADDGGIRLHYPHGGIAHSSEAQYRAWLEDVAANGGRIIDTKGFSNGNDRVWPPDEPDAHDPRMVVYGLDEVDVLALLDRYPDVDLQINTDHDHNAKSDGDSGNGDGGALSKDQVAKLDGVLLKAFKRQIMPPSLDAIEKDAWTSDEDVPEYVVESIQDVFDVGGVFDRFDSISGRVANTISDTLEDSLTQPQGWSLDSMVDNLSDQLPRAGESDLERIARTESAAVLNEAREDGYRDRNLDDAKFYWQGPDDSRTTEACEELKKETNPSKGGDPVSLPKLVNEEEAVQGRYFPDLDFRRHTIHPNERHTFVRAAGTGFGDEPDVDVDVDVPGAEEFNEQFEAGDANVQPQELSAKSHDDVDSYKTVVDRVAKATTVTRRVGQIEDALGSPLPVVLRSCLEDAGSTRGAHKELNRRLADADEWDIDEDGKVSTATIYEWADRYSGHVEHLT